jgi:nitrite transporter NirC
MYSQEFEAVATAARSKTDLLKTRPWAYLLASILAGVFIGFGVILSNTAAALTASSSLSRLVSGLTFAGGLSLVVFAGAELFTGNHFVIGSGILSGRVSLA